MKNILLCSMMLITASSFSLRAMLFESPEKLHEFYSSSPLSEIEKQLVERTITKNGPQPIRTAIQYYNHQNSLTVFEIKETFYKDSTDPLAKTIFDAIEKIEKNRPKNTNAVVKNDLIPSNYLGLGTRYYWNDNKNTVRINASLYNKEALQTLCLSCNE